MRILFLFLFPLFLIVLGIYGAGSSLPAQTTTIRGVMLPVAQADLWKLVNDFEAMPGWHPKVDSITAIPEPGSQETLWHVKAAEKQSYTLKKTYHLEPDVLRLAIEENTLPYTAEWDISLMDKTPPPEEGDEKAEAPKPESFLKITETAHTGNPFARFFMQYFIGYESAVEDYLRGIAAKLEAPQAEIRELVA